MLGLPTLRKVLLRPLQEMAAALSMVFRPRQPTLCESSWPAASVCPNQAAWGNPVPPSPGVLLTLGLHMLSHWLGKPRGPELPSRYVLWATYVFLSFVITLLKKKKKGRSRRY